MIGWIVAILVSLLLGVSIAINIRFARHLLSIESRVQESMDILDECYGEISRVLEMPVFFDSIEIRQVITQIDRSREAVLHVANKLGVGDSAEETQEELTE